MTKSNYESDFYSCIDFKTLFKELINAKTLVKDYTKIIKRGEFLRDSCPEIKLEDMLKDLNSKI